MCYIHINKIVYSAINSVSFKTIEAEEKKSNIKQKKSSVKTPQAQKGT